MGCGDGCELWPTPTKVKCELVKTLAILTSNVSTNDLKVLVDAVVGDRDLSSIYRGREALAAELGLKLGLNKKAVSNVVDVARRACKCYAGLLGTNRAGHKGYADAFVQPKLFPGRMAVAAKWGPPTYAERAAKPWLLDAPRMIFVSDMGDPTRPMHVVEELGTADSRRRFVPAETELERRNAVEMSICEFAGIHTPALEHGLQFI